jgi:hypothetical protein
MLGNLEIDQLAAMRPQPRKRPFLVRTHEPAVTGDVRGENGGQLTFDAFCGQSGLPPVVALRHQPVLADILDSQHREIT